MDTAQQVAALFTKCTFDPVRPDPNRVADEDLLALAQQDLRDAYAHLYHVAERVVWGLDEVADLQDALVAVDVQRCRAQTVRRGGP